MNGQPAPPTPPANDLARAFARQVGSWARGAGASPAAALAAEQAAHDTSLATSDGQVCLALAGRPGVQTLRALLLTSGVVGTAQHAGARPLVIDDAQRLYLHRYFDLERRLARRLRQAAQAPVDEPDLASLTLLQTLFSDPASMIPAAATIGQRRAVETALCGRLTVISGGPGTGKTSTVVNLLACLLAQDPHGRIALAAPTGKAAARMTQALRERAAHLPAALRERLPAEAFTVHRLLGTTPGGGFVHHAGNPLTISVLVVDEASMLDLALATRLLEAVPDNARIVLLGDRDQLAAVEAGSVFAEISARPGAASAAGSADSADSADSVKASSPAGLASRVVWLEHNFRFTGHSGVGRLAGHIRAGRAEQALATLQADSDGDGTLRWLDGPEPPIWPAVMDGYKPFFDAVTVAGIDAVAAAWNTFRVLCAVRDGPRGVMAVNERVSAQARSQLARQDHRPESPWYPGRPVMVLRNEPALRLFNGDIGLTLPDPAADGALRVFFPATRAATTPGGAWRSVAPARLPEHQTAYAMTVHKAQGSEFDRVLLLLPVQGSRVLTRELLYTAVTRVRQGLTLCASADLLRAALAQTTQRHSGLLDRLLEAGE